MGVMTVSYFASIIRIQIFIIYTIQWLAKKQFSRSHHDLFLPHEHGGKALKSDLTILQYRGSENLIIF